MQDYVGGTRSVSRHHGRRPGFIRCRPLAIPQVRLDYGSFPAESYANKIPSSDAAIVDHQTQRTAPRFDNPNRVVLGARFWGEWSGVRLTVFEKLRPSIGRNTFGLGQGVQTIAAGEGGGRARNGTPRARDWRRRTVNPRRHHADLIDRPPEQEKENCTGHSRACL